MIGVPFGTAIIAAAIEAGIRVKLQCRLYIDDGFLIFAFLALAAATTVLYEELNILCLAEEIVRDFVSEHMGHLPRIVNVAAKIPIYQPTDYLHRILSWLVLFSVKFSFLSLFHQLVDRLPRLLLHWRVVILISVIAFGYCIFMLSWSARIRMLQHVGRSPTNF